MKKLTEEDIKYRHITPAIEQAGWTKSQVPMEYFFTDGQVLVRGNTVKRGKRKKADYLLTHKDRQFPYLMLIDGNELVDLVLQHYEEFDSRYKGLIPLKRVYVPDQESED